MNCIPKQYANVLMASESVKPPFMKHSYLWFLNLRPTKLESALSQGILQFDASLGQWNYALGIPQLW